MPRTIKLSEEWAQRFLLSYKDEKELYDRMQKFELATKQLWTEFEIAHDVRGKRLAYNPEKDFVEVHEKVDPRQAPLRGMPGAPVGDGKPLPKIFRGETFWNKFKKFLWS